MGVAKARCDAPAAQLDDATAWPDPRRDRRIGVDRDDPAVTNGDGAGHRPGTVLRRDAAATQDEVGGTVGSHGPRMTVTVARGPSISPVATRGRLGPAADSMRL